MRGGRNAHLVTPRGIKHFSTAPYSFSWAERQRERVGVLEEACGDQLGSGWDERVRGAVDGDRSLKGGKVRRTMD